MAKSTYEFGEFLLEPDKRLLLRNGQPVALTPKAFETLLVLVECRDRVAEKSELMLRLWPDHVVEEANLTQQIFTLRKALGDSPEGTHFIHTIPRHGYRFVAEVRVVEPGTPAAGPGPDSPALGAPPRRRAWPRLALVALAAVALSATATYLLSPRAAVPAKGRVMLAVLPFENLGESADDEYLADGLTEEILTILGRVSPERLGVIARTSVTPYKTTAKAVREIARELQVDYVLEGSVRHAGGRLRVTAQLIEVETQTHLWAQAYERELSEAFRVETDIAQAIAHQLSIQLLPGALVPLGPTSHEAHVAYLKGLYFWNKRDAAGLQRAIALFREAIDLDPGYARAHAGLAAAHASLATSADALAAREARALAEAGARRALELDPRLPEGHAALAAVRCRFDWNWPECERELTQALRLDPNYATGHHWLGELYVVQGRFEQGQAELKKAHALDPLSPAIHTNLGVAYMYAGAYDAALACFAQALEIDPQFLLAHRVKGLTLVRSGRVEEGLASLRHARALDPRSAHAAADLGYALGRAGRLSEARATLGELDALAKLRPVSAYDFAVVHAGLGETAAALTWLEKAHAERATGVRWLKVDPIFDPLRGDRRFQELLRNIGLLD